MIFISSSCLRHRRIDRSVGELAEMGFRAIELSGGTEAYDGLVDDLLSLQARYGLTYRCHNYFPPPPSPFVLNLAADDAALLQRSLEHVRGALDLSRTLGADALGVHAGFRLAPDPADLGRRMPAQILTPYERAVERFCSSVEQLDREAGDRGIRLYVENNVCSKTNLAAFDGENPFLLTDSRTFADLRRRTSIALLLDVAHLKVSCRSLGLSFIDELVVLAPQTDYVHVSDNDGTADTNEGLRRSSALFEALSRFDWTGYTFTLEVYTGQDRIVESYESLSAIIAAYE